MGYEATVIEVMIASPSDVVRERSVVREVLGQWNASHSQERSTVLLPVAWETHSAPDLGGRPQQLINDRLLARCDLLVGVFWSRIGSDTGVAVSGTVEEIREHHALGKPVMLYFSQAPLPQDHSSEQFAEVRKLKDWAFHQGLVGQYEDPRDLKERLLRDLHQNVLHNDYLQKQIRSSNPTVLSSGAVVRQSQSLSADAKLALKRAAESDGMIIAKRNIGGMYVKAGHVELTAQGTARDGARWKAAVDELARAALIADYNGRGEIYEVTQTGYEEADRLLN